VGGTIAARDNNIGAVGVAPEASIYVACVVGDNGGFLSVRIMWRPSMNVFWQEH
jgi:hypothetical protein